EQARGPVLRTALDELPGERVEAFHARAAAEETLEPVEDAGARAARERATPYPLRLARLTHLDQRVAEADRGRLEVRERAQQAAQLRRTAGDVLDRHRALIAHAD